MPKPKKKLLTVKFDHEVLAEFHAAVDILRGRSASEYVHNFARQSIEEARKRVSKEEFAALTALKSKEILKRSAAKSKERRRGESSKTSPLETPHGNNKAA